MMIKITKLNYGQPVEATCPEHGKVEIVSMPTQGTGSLKRIARAKAAGGKVHYGNSPSLGELSCGCKFTTEEVDNELSKKFNVVCRLIELANNIHFENRHEMKTDENHQDFALRMFNIFKEDVIQGVVCDEIKLHHDFDGRDYNKIISEFEGIEEYLHNGSNYKIGSEDNIIVKYYYQPPTQELPTSFTWDDFYTLKNDGSMEVAQYLINWCKHNNIVVNLTGDENPQEIANACVKAMYSDVEL